MKHGLFLILLLGLVSPPAIGQESSLHSSNGSDGYRPTRSQSSGVARLELFCHAEDFDPGYDGPNKKDLEKHVARELRRTFPQLQFTTNTDPGKEPPGKWLYIHIALSGSGLSTDICAAHAEINVSIYDPEKTERHRAMVTRVTTSALRQHIVRDFKQTLTKAIEMVSDGWHEPNDNQRITSYYTERY